MKKKNKMKKIILVVSILIVSVLNAQNLVENGGFEETRGEYLGKVKFNNWEFSDYIHHSKGEAHNGNQSLKIYNSGIVRGSSIKVEKNAEYTLKFWYKGYEENKAEGDTLIRRFDIKTSIEWYDKNGRKLKNKSNEKFLEPEYPCDWTKGEYVFKAFSSAVSAKINFSLKSNGGPIFIDDVSFEKTGESSTEDSSGIQVPSEFRAEIYQREIDLSWNKENDDNLKWEMVFNGKSITLDRNYCNLTDLEPNTKYEVKLRTIDGNKKSDFIEQSIWTKRIEYDENDDNRVPHLRTLGIYGNCSKKIKLFYNDLYNPNAEIKYFVDGEQVQPNGKDFIFPKTGKQKLRVIIKEKEGFEWEIEYNLNVK